jgi:hypothetical protein
MRTTAPNACAPVNARRIRALHLEMQFQTELDLALWQHG